MQCKGSDNSGIRKLPGTGRRRTETVNFDSNCIKHNNKTRFKGLFYKKGA